jgi:nucleotide-binding universal stress UspA family protein
MKVLFAYDGSECAAAAIDDLYRAGLPDNTRFVVLSIEEDCSMPPSNLKTLEAIEDIDRREDYLALARCAAARMRWFHQGWKIEVEVGRGSPAKGIIEKAVQSKPDLIVIGSHGRAAPGGAYFGSVAQKVLREAPCSVRIARGRYVVPDSPARIIVGIDGSMDVNRAVKAVFSRNWPEGTEIRMVNGMVKTTAASAGLPHAQAANSIGGESAETWKAIGSALTTLNSMGLKVSVIAKHVEPAHLLCAEAERWRADCIFVWSRDRGALDRSSVSAEVAANADCSVEVIRIME